MIEVTEPHTGLLRLGLALPQSLIFWERARHDATPSELVQTALEEGWYPELSRARVDYLVKQLARRFPFSARRMLEFQRRAENSGNQLVCHWHLQLTDPLYRHFTRDFLLSQWSTGNASVDLEECENWVREQEVARDWKPVTVRRMGSGLLNAATEAGLCSGSGRGEHLLKIPTVNTEDIEYLRLLLAEAGASEQLHGYLLSVGVSAEVEQL